MTSRVWGWGCTWGATVVRRYAASSPVAALGSFSPGTSTRQRTCKGGMFNLIQIPVPNPVACRHDMFTDPLILLITFKQVGMLEQPCEL